MNMLGTVIRITSSSIVTVYFHRSNRQDVSDNNTKLLQLLPITLKAKS